MHKTLTVQARGPLKGTTSVPGDKSITHRALILSGLARGVSRIREPLDAADTRATASAMSAIGAEIVWKDNIATVLGVDGRCQCSKTALDLGNSGTGLRLLAGALAGRGIAVDLTGDDSLRKRPMDRVTLPLRTMGAEIRSTDGVAPISIFPSKALQAIDYTLPVASAQVKSAILLAALSAHDKTTVRDNFGTRDHTERMLPAFGACTRVAGREISVFPSSLSATDLTVPGDISSAAFLVAAALLVAGSEIRLTSVGVNPTRTGFLNAIQRMGAYVLVGESRIEAGEPMADITVRAQALRGIHIRPEEIPSMIDELPILMVLAAFASGRTILEGVGELRLKESDRVESMQRGLEQLGVNVSADRDTVSIEGGGARGGAVIASHGDHRVAMSFALSGLALEKPVTVSQAEWIVTSFPDFAERLRALGAEVQTAC